VKLLGKIGKISLRVLIVSFLVLCLLELTYRFQWVDFYASEWEYHNADIEVEGKESLLVLGDSFSADPDGWVYMLRDSLSDHVVFNASIPGVGPETFAFMFKRRQSSANPQHVIVQMYVGNDQYDYEKPVNWSEYGFLRNLFWTCSNSFRSLNFLNYRLGQSSVEDHTENAKLEESFDKRKYSARTKLYIQGDENYPANLIRIDDGDISGIVKYLQFMKENATEECRFSILLIPHCTQVSESYIVSYKALGSKIDTTVLGTSYWNQRLTTLGFEVIDPLDYFIQLEAEGQQLYFENDPHLNTKGNACLTQFVLQELDK